LSALYESITLSPSLEECTTLEEKIIMAIDLDVCRSGLPSGDEDSWKQGSLRRVLIAVALFDTRVAYVQGMNFIATFALQNLDWREDAAFTLLVRLIFSPFYRLGMFFSSPDLRGVQDISLAMDNMLPKCSRGLSKHFKSLGLSTVLVFEWSFSLFTLVLPPEQCAQVWDAIFKEGVHPLAHAITLQLLLHLEKYVMGKGSHETLMALKGYARAKTVGSSTDPGECSGLPPPIQPPLDLVDKAKALARFLKLPRGWGGGK